MSEQPRRQSLWRALPLIGFTISEWQAWHEEQAQRCFSLAPMPQDASELPPYPIDMWPRLALPYGPLDEAGVPYARATKTYPAGHYATTIAQYALANWNTYLATGDARHKQAFMIQADWLVVNESRLSKDASGWPFTFPLHDYYALAPWLSGLTQGNGISVLVRAYRLTGEDVFLQVARRAVRTFELDIRDGGVSTSIGDDGVFFEEVAAYPAAHILNGYIYALFGLYDYVALTRDAQIATLIQDSLTTMHSLINEFDMGYWSRYDLLHRHPAPRFYHALHVTMLDALARYSGCEHCAALATRWAEYQHSFRCRFSYFIVSRIVRYHRGLRRLGIRGAFLRIFGAKGQTTPTSNRFTTTVPPEVHLNTVKREVPQ